MELRGGGVLMRSPPPPPPAAAPAASSSSSSSSSSAGASKPPPPTTNQQPRPNSASSTVTLAVSSSASFSSSGGGKGGGNPPPAAAGNKSRKEQLTERLSRSRRSRFNFGPDSNNNNHHPSAGKDDSNSNNNNNSGKDNPTKKDTTLAVPSSPAEKRIALARAHNSSNKKLQVVAGGGGGSGGAAGNNHGRAGPPSLSNNSNKLDEVKGGGNARSKKFGAMGRTVAGRNPLLPARASASFAVGNNNNNNNNPSAWGPTPPAPPQGGGTAGTAAGAPAVQRRAAFPSRLGESLRAEEEANEEDTHKEDAKEVGAKKEAGMAEAGAAATAAAAAAAEEAPSPPDRPRLRLGASPGSSSNAVNNTNNNLGAVPGAAEVAVNSSLAAPSLRTSRGRVPPSVGNANDDDDEEEVESIVLLPSASSSSNASSRNRNHHLLRLARPGVSLSASSSSSSSSGTSMPKELPHPTFGKAAAPNKAGAWRKGGAAAAAAAAPRQYHQQVVIPVQAPPAAISRPVTYLPKEAAPLLPSTASSSDPPQGDASHRGPTLASQGQPTSSSVAAPLSIGASTSSSSSSPTHAAKTSPKQLAAAIAASSTSGSADVHSLSRWRRGNTTTTGANHGTAAGKAVGPFTTPATSKSTTSTSTTAPPQPSAPPTSEATAALPARHHWKPGHVSTTVSAGEKKESHGPKTSSNQEGGAVAVADAAPPSPPLSPPRINPWKQMSKVRSGANPAAAASSTPVTHPNATQKQPAASSSAAAAGSAVPSRVASRWGSRNVPQKEEGLGIPFSDSQGSHGVVDKQASFGPHDPASFDGLLDEEKKEDADGYIDPPVRPPSVMERFRSDPSHGAGSAGPAPFNPGSRSPAPHPAFPAARTASPFGGGRSGAEPHVGPSKRSASSRPAYLPTGGSSPVPPLHAREAGAPETAQIEADSARPAAGGAVIETPDKVSVSSMKARFASPTVASSSRGGGGGTPKSPGPTKRLQRPPMQQPTVESPRSQSAIKSRAMGSPNPSAARSSSVGRFASPTLASQKRSGGSPLPSPRNGISTTERVTVSNMTAKLSKPTVAKSSFLQPTKSSAAKCSPRKDVTSGHLSPLPSPTAADLSHDQMRIEPRSTIETPEPVNVRSMQGMFSGNKVGTKKAAASRGALPSSPPLRYASTLSPPVYDARRAARERSTDVATPNAPPLPSRSIGKSSGPSSSPTPSWLKRSQGRDDFMSTVNAPRDTGLSALSMPKLEEPALTIVDAPKAEEFVSPSRPKSPRDRPTSIPRWKQLQAIDSMEPGSDIAIEGTRPPASPRSPMERPWNKDLESPRGWRHRLQATLSEKSNDGEDLLAPPATKSSLIQLAADSVHAIDFDRGIPIPELKKSSGSGSREYEDVSDGGGAIPSHLPAEFAESLELHLDSKSVQGDRVVQRQMAGQPESEPQPSSGIVFGDPSTYGAAGGDAEAMPPRVLDRARAIANWKGGLGAKPAKSSTAEEAADIDDVNNVILEELLASDSTHDEDRITKSREELDRVSRSREELADDSLPNATLSSPIGSRRGDSAVLRFWKDTSREEFDGAQEWLNCDPDLTSGAEVPRPDSPSLRKRYISNSYKPRVEDINLSSLSDWKRLNSPASDQRSQAPPDMFPSDPFALETLAGLYEEPVKGVPPAFDPFADAPLSDVDAFDSSVVDFFNASVRVPSSPAPTAFSAPNFEPKVFENPDHDSCLTSLHNDRHESAPVARDERRRTSWGLGGRKSRRTNAI